MAKRQDPSGPPPGFDGQPPPVMPMGPMEARLFDALTEITGEFDTDLDRKTWASFQRRCAPFQEKYDKLMAEFHAEVVEPACAALRGNLEKKQTFRRALPLVIVASIMGAGLLLLFLFGGRFLGGVPADALSTPASAVIMPATLAPVEVPAELKDLKVEKGSFNAVRSEINRLCLQAPMGDAVAATKMTVDLLKGKKGDAAAVLIDLKKTASRCQSK